MLKIVANPHAREVSATRRMKRAFSWLLENGYVKLSSTRDFVVTARGRGVLGRAGIRS